jgi:hypothetical protein
MTEKGNDRKAKEILHSAYAQAQNDTLFVTLRRKPKGLLWRFFPFASLRVRMTKKRRGRVSSLKLLILKGL